MATTNVTVTGSYTTTDTALYGTTVSAIVKRNGVNVGPATGTVSNSGVLAFTFNDVNVPPNPVPVAPYTYSIELANPALFGCASPVSVSSPANLFIGSQEWSPAVAHVGQTATWTVTGKPNTTVALHLMKFINGSWVQQSFIAGAVFNANGVFTVTTGVATVADIGIYEYWMLPADNPNATTTMCQRGRIETAA